MNCALTPLVEIEVNDDGSNLIITQINTINKTLPLVDGSDNVFEKAVKHVQDSYCDAHIKIPYMLLGGCRANKNNNRKRN